MLELLYIALSAVFLANFWDDCLDEGMIFEKLGKAIKDKWWGDPLGGCIICTTFWIFVLMFFLNAHYAHIWYFLAGVGLSHFVLRLLMNKDII